MAGYCTSRADVFPWADSKWECDPWVQNVHGNKLPYYLYITYIFISFCFWISFGGICQPYRGGSTLCDGEFDETINVHTSRNVQSQEVLTSTLNNVISFSSFDTVSSHCQNLIRSVLCLHYYTPCGLDAALVSICPEECFYVQNSCSQIWNDLERLLKVSGTDLRFINCSNPGEILDPLPHCCVDARITIDTANSGQAQYNMWSQIYLLQNSMWSFSLFALQYLQLMLLRWLLE